MFESFTVASSGNLVRHLLVPMMYFGTADLLSATDATHLGGPPGVSGDRTLMKTQYSISANRYS